MVREQLKQKAQSISKVPSHYQLMIEDYGEKYEKERRGFFSLEGKRKKGGGKNGGPGYCRSRQWKWRKRRHERSPRKIFGGSV